MSTSNAESEIRERVESLARALRAKDVDALMDHYAPNVITFDVQPPLRVVGDAYRKNFERWFASVEGSIDYEMSDMTLAAGENVGFCGFLARVRGGRAAGERFDYSVRVTSCFVKRNGEWKVSHEHVSLPVDMTTGEPRVASSEGTERTCARCEARVRVV
jgi:ketosteroid isomerase-like protein